MSVRNHIHRLMKPANYRLECTHLTKMFSKIPSFVVISYFLLRIGNCHINSEEEIDDLIHAEMSDCQQKAGLGVVIVAKNNNGRGISRDLAYVKGFGYKNLEEKTVADEETMFCIGSLTKHFTTILVMHLLELLKEKGHRYSLQSAVTEIDPGLDFPGSQFMNITLEDIMSHRSGIAEVFGPFWIGYSGNTTRKELAHIAARLPRLAANRAKYIYNNHVFSVTGYLTEVLGGILLKTHVSWEDLLNIFFFHPLGIDSLVKFAGNNFTSFGQLATPYLTKNGQYVKLDDNVLRLIEPAGPAGSLCMSPNAMRIWMEFLIQRGSLNRMISNSHIYYNQPIVSKESVEDTWQPRIFFHSQTSPKNRFETDDSTSYTMDDYIRERKENAGYALGWVASKHRGHRSLDHSGGFYNYLSLFSIFPEQNISIFTSSAGPYIAATRNLLWRLHYNIFDRLMGFPRSVPYKCINETILNATQQFDNNQTLIEVDPQNYIGTFHHSVHGYLKVIPGDTPSGVNLLLGRYGNASIECRSSKTVCELRFQGMLWWVSDSDAFKGDKGPNRTILFDTTCTGYVTHITLPLYCDEVPAVFQRRSEHYMRKLIMPIEDCSGNGSRCLLIDIYDVMRFFVFCLLSMIFYP